LDTQMSVGGLDQQLTIADNRIPNPIHRLAIPSGGFREPQCLEFKVQSPT
jgi:hypothetical protein